MSECIIKAERLTKIYVLPAERIQAVREVDLEVREREFIAVMGPSGSGKTTLLDSLGCLVTISEGKLVVMGKDVSHVREKELVRLRREYFGYVFQDFLLIPTLTAAENVELPLFFAGKPCDRAHSRTLLERVGLGSRMNHLPKELSGGEKQRVAIARALSTSPRVLFADEPTGNLDTKSAEEVFALFARLNREEGLTILVTTHNPQLGSRASRIIYLKDGRMVTKEQSTLL